jgi:plasmid maintenance system antidote protein VapI
MSMPENLTVTEAAAALQVARVTLSKILNGSAGISTDEELVLSQ